jgi:hypothetical protein
MVLLLLFAARVAVWLWKICPNSFSTYHTSPPGVYPARTYQKNTWVLGIFWVLGVPISDIPSQFLYGYIPDT